jgi:phage terminase large subunit GpA-like protein
VSNTLDALEEEVCGLLAPPPRLTVSGWADEFRVLAPEASAEPGPWVTSRTPYLRAVMDAFTDPRTETIVLLKSSQVGGTEIVVNALGRAIHLDPAPSMVLQPTLEMASAFSKDRLTPAIRLSPELASRVALSRSQRTSSTLLHKTFPGGHVTIAGANSPASLAARPIRYLFLDEVDRYPASAGAEGDPASLAVARTRTFLRRKIVVLSSPTIKGASRIEDWYAISDQRRFHVPCPRCGERFVPAWSDVRWESRDPMTAHVICPLCAGRIEDAERPAMIAAGEWRASAPFDGVAGFHVWEFFAPWRSLRDLAKQFLDSRSSVEQRQAFTNTVLGEVWSPPAESVEASALLLRRESYPADTLPEGVRVLTCGVDTQDDRLEALVVGWGIGEEAWIIARETILGDPGRPDVWAELDEVLGQEWRGAGGGTMRVACTLVDAGGHRAQGVYAAVVARQSRRVFACFGRAGGLAGLLVSPPRALKTGAGTVHRRLVDTHQAKMILFARLRITDDGPEKIHFPHGLGQQFFDELTAERLVTRRSRLGVPEKVWEQVHERNESLDTFVYALAALRVLAPTPARLTQLLAVV